MKKYEEQIVNYLIGGILGLVFLIPFLCAYINYIYEKITFHGLSSLALSSLCVLSVFLLFTIAIGVVISNQEKKDVLPILPIYFRFTPFISMFLFINIFNGFGISLFFSVILSIVVAVINYLFVEKFIW